MDSRDRKQAIFCVVHGGTDVSLRTKSIEYLTTLPWDGYAIGGSLGEFYHLAGIDSATTPNERKKKILNSWSHNNPLCR